MGDPAVLESPVSTLIRDAVVGREIGEPVVRKSSQNGTGEPHGVGEVVGERPLKETNRVVVYEVDIEIDVVPDDVT